MTDEVFKIVSISGNYSRVVCYGDTISLFHATTSSYLAVDEQGWDASFYSDFWIDSSVLIQKKEKRIEKKKKRKRKI